MKAAVAALLLVVASPAAAFYQEPAKPPGTGGGPGGWTYKPPGATPINGGRIGGGSVTINRGNGSVTRPLSWKLKPGAGRAIAGGLIRGGAWGAALGLADWAAEQCIHRAPGGGWLLKCGKDDDEPYLPGKLVYTNGRISGKFYGSADEACKAAVFHQSGDAKAQHRIESTGQDQWICYRVYKSHEAHMTGVYRRYFCEGPPPLYSDDGKCPLPSGKDGKEITPEEAENILANAPLPPVAPPGVPLPVGDPIFNPSPGPNPKPRPLTMPIGDPVPNLSPDPSPEPEPGAQPQPDKQKLTWTQPAVEITHSPTEDQPLRMEMKPIDIPVSGPSDRQKVREGKPEPAPAAPGGVKPPTDTPIVGGQPPEPFDLCREYPDILACQQLGDVEATDLKHTNVPLSIRPAPGFERAAGCPADRTFTVFGRQYAISWVPLCQLAQGIRPVLVSIAAISALLAFLGLSRKE